MHRLRLALLVAAVPFLMAQAETHYPDRTQVFNVTDAKYGAVSDAVAAAGGDFCNNLTKGPIKGTIQTSSWTTCDVAGAGTHDTDAFQAAWDAACAAGGGTVYVPCGSYRVGGPGATHFLEPAEGCTGVTWLGESRECTKIYYGPEGRDGKIFSSGSLTSKASYLTFANLHFLDDDTEAHGHGYYIIDDGDLTATAPHTAEIQTYEEHSGTMPNCTAAGEPWDCCTGVDLGCTVKVTAAAHGLQNGDYVEIVDDDDDALDGFYWVTKTNANAFWIEAEDDAAPDDGDFFIRPDAGDSVTWNGGTEAGTVISWDSTNGILRIQPVVGDTIADDGLDDLNFACAHVGSPHGNGDWTATNVGGTTYHAPTTEESHGLNLNYCDHCTLRDSIVEGFGDEAIDVAYSDNVRIEDTIFINSPGGAYGGAAVNFGTETTNSSIINNRFTGGFGSGVGKSANLENNDTEPISNIVVCGNTFTDPDTTAEAVPHTAIGFHPVNGPILGVLVCDNIFDFDFATWGINQSTSGEGINGLIIADNVMRQAAINLFTEGIESVHIKGNTLSGMGIVGENDFVEASGIRVSGAFIDVSDNEIRDYPVACTLFGGTQNGEIAFIGNECLDNGWNLNLSLVRLAQATTANAARVFDNLFKTPSYTHSSFESIDCNGMVGSYVRSNTFLSPRRHGILDCRVIEDNVIDTPGGDCITTTLDNAIITGNACDTPVDDGIVVGGDYAVVSDNALNAIGDDAIEIAGALATVSDNTFHGVAGDVIQDDAGAFVTCHGNTSYSDDYIVVDENGGLAGGTPSVGEAVTWGGGGEGGVVVGWSSPNITIVPDSFAADKIASGADVITGAGWTITNGTVSDAGTVGPAINCDSQGSTASNTTTIPAD